MVPSKFLKLSILNLDSITKLGTKLNFLRFILPKLSTPLIAFNLFSSMLHLRGILTLSACLGSVRSLEVVLEGVEQHFDGFSEFRSGGWKNNFSCEVKWLNGKPSKEFSKTKHLIYSGSVNFQPTSTTLTLKAKDFTISTKP